MLELRCRHCGGRLSAGDEEVFVGGATVVVRSGFLLRCKHCGTEYAPGDELKLPETVSIDVHQEVARVENGGTVIGVSLNFGDFD